ncbi:ATP-binding protein [Cupriavidus pauculus]|uniref:ATP-binding protein n=1 Tax=Cupriavidus pauculus TaxID=82633 RepID=UPI001D0CAC2B|nr:ATP-binding protein [Cupriavidus pauculus]
MNDRACQDGKRPAPERSRSAEPMRAPTNQQFLSQKPRLQLDRDLVLSEGTSLRLSECLTKLRHRKTIYVDWNFGSVDPMGLSTILNFYGPPGTGKTMAAEALAGTLQMPFMPLGIAELESKFMGDTAKNIRTAFEAARMEGALLFFDEADTLLGKRLSSVTQGVDNEVNAMRSTLLIELERFDGIVVFATNFAKNYDEAFRSRIGYHVHFDLPDLAARKRLWGRMLVPDIPIESTREALVTQAATLSDGFSGREIRTCMRLALPKALHDAERLSRPAALATAHIEAAITEVRRANADISSTQPVARRASGDVTVSRQLLGVTQVQ